MSDQSDSYPASLSVDYPEGKRKRLTVLFRIILVIPIVILLSLVRSATVGDDGDDGSAYQYASGGILFLPTLLMILFREKYPNWWFDWNVALVKFTTRVTSYFLLLRDEYPSTDEEQAIHINIAYPDVPKDLNRWLPLVKWLLAIPHYIILFFLQIVALLCVVLAWFLILITGQYPRSLFDFVVGVEQWSLRVTAYAFLLSTDRYPPFSLEVDRS